MPRGQVAELVTSAGVPGLTKDEVLEGKKRRQR